MEAPLVEGDCIGPTQVKVRRLIVSFPNSQKNPNANLFFFSFFAVQQLDGLSRMQQTITTPT